MTVQITNVKVLDPNGKFSDPFRLQISFECQSPGVKEDLEFKLVYVGAASDASCDQELDSIVVGPITVGKSQFVFEAPPPDPTKISRSDILDVTIVLLSCSYKGQEFNRIGYYVSHEYPEMVANPEQIDISRISRNILAGEPRVTRFCIDWDRPPKPQSGRPTSDIGHPSAMAAGSDASDKPRDFSELSEMDQREIQMMAEKYTDDSLVAGNLGSRVEEDDDEEDDEDDEDDSKSVDLSMEED